MMRNLRAALVFLTRIPLRADDRPGSSVAAWFPLAGVVIGVMVGAVIAGVGHLTPPFVAAAVGVMIGVAITGAFHEDGLADVADAFVGGWTPEQRVAILRDPLHGSYGVAALCGSIVVRVACFDALASSPAVAFSVAVAAHALARAGAVAVMSIAPPARVDGLGATHATGLRRSDAAIGIVLGIAIAALVTGWWVGPFTAAAAIAALGVAWWSMRKIGGVNGDVLGAVEQIGECLVLIVATALATRSNLWWR